MRKTMIKKVNLSMLLAVVFMLLTSTSVFAGKPADTDTSNDFTVQDVTKEYEGKSWLYVLQREFLLSYNKDYIISYGIHSVNGVRNGKSIVFEYDYTKDQDQVEAIEDDVLMGEQMLSIKPGFVGEVVLRVYKGDNETNSKKFVLVTVLPEKQETPSTPSTPTPTPESEPTPTPIATPTETVLSSMPKPVLKSAKNNKKGKVTVKWKKLSSKQKKKIQKIEIECVCSDGVKTIKYVGKSKSSVVLKGLVKGQTYQIRVRTVNGNNVSNWSKTKTVKIKK